MVKVVVQKCGCWPNSIGVNQKATPPLVNCSFVNHARCVAPLVSNFKQQTHCDCPPKCIQDETVIDSIQYGKYQGGKLIRRDAMLTSIMIYLKPEHRYHDMFGQIYSRIYLFRVYRIEQLEYEATQFFSDVGGAAGLLLGLR